MSNGRVAAFFWVFVLFCLQNFSSYLLGAAAPSLLLIGVMVYSLNEGSRFGLLLGLFAGFLSDLFGQGALGFGMMQLASVGVLSGLVSTQIFQEGYFTELFLPAVALYFSALAEILFTQNISGDAWGWACLGYAFRPWTLANTALVSPILFSFLKKHPSSRHYFLSAIR